MKIYKSDSGKVEVKAYYYSHSYCIQATYTDGTVLVGRYPTVEKANAEFKRAKALHPDLKLVK